MTWFWLFVGLLAVTLITFTWLLWYCHRKANGRAG